ncbi:39S ribosomal protein L27, mitochondrial isoform X2 [Nycticebus coucang]|uniref:39S ribosomal protein L27, mitochondrial isoform X2 n=1 Tax=Nycticebus coucang TaxID=9470 RepID=UPI00234C0EF4|nr:39S ribosomal protein L27, mitochondrial isoform X2 [Nycticebus coucang]
MSLLSPSPATALAIRNASKKTGGSSKNLGGKSSGKRFGIKKMEGHYVHAGNILGTQRRFRWHPGAHDEFNPHWTLPKGRRCLCLQLKPHQPRVWDLGTERDGSCLCFRAWGSAKPAIAVLIALQPEGHAPQFPNDLRPTLQLTSPLPYPSEDPPRFFKPLAEQATPPVLSLGVTPSSLSSPVHTLSQALIPAQSSTSSLPPTSQV